MNTRSQTWVPAGGVSTASGPTAYLGAEQALDAFRSGMRRLAGAVSVVTTKHGDQLSGLTATAICSMSASPPRILACVNIGGRSFRAISESRCMAINVLSAKHEPLARRFASSATDPFEGATWTHAATGAPLLADALVSFDCDVAEMFVTKSHAIVIGEIRHIAYADTCEPLLYLDGRFLSTGSLPT